MKNYTKTEIIAGVTTFLATMYIIIVNPAILSFISQHKRRRAVFQ
jgi:xanthine/uracil/vitamin C permease (AzgA family)